VGVVSGQSVYTTSPGAIAYNVSSDGYAYTMNSRGSKTISPEDAAWLRGVYPRLETTRLKSRAVSVLARARDEATVNWLMGIITREEESSDVRASVLSRMGSDLPIAQLGRLYDGASTRQVREQIVSVLGRRKEPEATDKLIEIVRTGTDPQLRRSAISALTSKKDPRTTQLLLELVDR
jgi:HEAT repeat protein